jgi:flagellar motility protein MotE (MotC chaperone)
MSMLRTRFGPGALAILSLLLASSGALRLGAGAGQALAEGSTVNPAEDHAPTSADCPAPPAALAAALAERADEIDNRSIAVEDRMAALALAEEAITARLTELEASETQLRATLSLANGAAEQDLARLTAVYEAMKPKDAAALFEKMESDFAAGFLSRMRPEAAAQVLSGMRPESAYTVSALIAGRNALVPKQ